MKTQEKVDTLELILKNSDLIPGVLIFLQRPTPEGTHEYALHARVKEDDYHHGKYFPPAGHYEEKDGDQSYEDCAMREAREEVGVILESFLRGHLLLRLGNAEKGSKQLHGIRPDMCFVVDKWKGELINNEPQKHGDIEWFTIDRLPDNMDIYAKQALHAIEDGGSFVSTHGFEDEPDIQRLLAFCDTNGSLGIRDLLKSS